MYIHMISLCNLSILESRSLRAGVIKMFVRYSRSSVHCIPHHSSCQSQQYERSSLDKLLEGAVDGRADFGALVEIDCGYGPLTDAFGGKFKFLILWLDYSDLEMGGTGGSLPCRRPCMHRWHRTG